MSEHSARPEARDMELAPTLERVMGIEPTTPGTTIRCSAS